MKKVILFLTVVTFVSTLILAGCGAPAAPTTTAPIITVTPSGPAPSPTATSKPTASPTTTAPVAKPIELKLSHNSSTASGSHVGFMEPWARAVEKASNGKVKITIYPAESINKAREAVVAAQSGITDIAWVLVSFFPGRFPLTEVTSLPFLNLKEGTVDGRKLGPAAINSHILQELYDSSPEMQAEWKGMKLIMLHTAGPTYLYTSKPINTLADIKGLKLRSYSGPDVEMWAKLGAAGVSLPLPEVYEAAQKKVIEGANVDTGGIYSYRLYELFQYQVNLEITLGRYALIMNEDKWKSLPPDVQQAIMKYGGIPGAEFAGDGMHFGMPGLNVDQAVLAKYKEIGKELKVTNFSAEDVAKFKELVKPITDKWVSDMEAKGLPGKKLLEQTQALLAKYK